MEAVREFMLISGLGMMVAGMTAYIITSILTIVQLRDKHPALHRSLGGNILSPRLLGWFLRLHFRRAGDAALNAIAFPGSIGVWAIIIGAVLATCSKVFNHV